MASRGSHLVAADRGFATGGGWSARFFAGGFGRILDRIDAGLVEGRIELTLPDGAQRILGGRGEGPAAVVRLNSYRALVRLAASGSVGWYKAWAKGEWASPDPVPLFDLFMRNAATLGRGGAGEGALAAGSTGSPMPCAATRRAAPAATSPTIMISAMISTPPGSIRA